MSGPVAREDALLDELAELREELRRARADAIEEAARVAETCDWLNAPPAGKHGTLRETIAAAIRALKGKP